MIYKSSASYAPCSLFSLLFSFNSFHKFHRLLETSLSLSLSLVLLSRPQLQVAMSGVLAPAQEAEKRTAANASVCSGSGLPGHPRAEYDVYRTAGEWWTDMNRVSEGG